MKKSLLLFFVSILLALTPEWGYSQQCPVFSKRNNGTGGVCSPSDIGRIPAGKIHTGRFTFTNSSPAGSYILDKVYLDGNLLQDGQNVYIGTIWFGNYNGASKDLCFYGNNNNDNATPAGHWKLYFTDPTTNNSFICDYFIDASGNPSSFSPGTIGSSITICSGADAGTLTTATAVAGLTGTVAYQWQKSTTSSSNGFTDIVGATNETYSPGILTQTTYFQRVASDIVNGVAVMSAASNVVTVTVTPNATAGTLSGNQNICVGGSTTFSSTVTGGTWSSSNTGIATINSNNGSISGVSAGTATMTYTVQGSNGCPNATATRTVTVSANPVAGTISGNTTICAGGSSILSSTSSGGTWSSSNSSVATINSNTGLVTGVGAGTATITYTVAGSGGCSSASATTTVTIVAAPSAGTLSGTQSVCVGNTVTFLSTVSGGAWSTANSSVATINSSTGLVTGVSAGTVTMTYTVTGTGGCPNATATRSVTVYAAPSAGTISGVSDLCTGNSSLFTSTIAGGTWSSSNTGVATVGSSSGLVTGVTAGSTTITYLVAGQGGCANATTTQALTITASIGTIVLSGSQNICLGGNSQFSSTVAGGAWSSSNVAVATVNSNTGLVTSVGAGTATITYTAPGNGSCSSVSATRSITVTAPPTQATLSGNQSICVNSSSQFSATYGGGSWTSSNTYVAVVDAYGNVVGTGAGTATITYTQFGSGGCSDVTSTRTVTVTAAPSAGTISGNNSICVGQTSTLSSSVSGGTWSSNNTSLATVDPSTGLVTTISAGTATITYSVTGTGGCGTVSATQIVTVNPLLSAGTLSGTQSICVGAATVFSSTISGGYWSSSNSGVASVNVNTGTVTGTGPGTAVITYTMPASGGCAAVSVTRTITVSATPNAGVITGPLNICTSSSNQFTTTGVGGSWTSSNTSVATVDSNTGVVVGVSAGSAFIYYTVPATSTCPSVTSTKQVIVAAPPSAGVVTGNHNFCIGTSSLFTSTVAGGTWSSSNIAVATVDPNTGMLTAIAAGSANIIYTVAGTGGCANATATTAITVATPVSAGTLTGTQNICAGSGTTFSSSVAGGTWTSNNAAIATVDALTGNIIGVAAGVTSITYTVAGSTGCPNATAIRTVTVTAAPVAGVISGAQSLCAGGYSLYTSSTPGGTWSSSNVAVATIDAASGYLTAIAPGLVIITYTVAGTGGCSSVSTTKIISVSAPTSAGTLNGNQTICVGTSSIFTSTVAGGAWTSSNAAIATVDAVTGVIVGVAPGTAYITYTVIGSGTCANATATRAITIAALPNAGTLSGAGGVCTGNATVFASTISGGVWSSSNITVATVDATTGLVTGVSAGTALITYTVSGAGGCSPVSASRAITVSAPANAGTLSGSQNVCVGSTVNFASSIAGGTWTTSNSQIALIDPATGLITGIAAGSVNITYTVAGQNGCASAAVSRVLAVNAPANAGTLSGVQVVCLGKTTVFSSTVIGGTWSTVNSSVATVDPNTGIVTGMGAGATSIVYTVAGTGGCGNTTVVRNITVNPLPTTPIIAANGPLSFCKEDNVRLSVYSLVGANYQWYKNGAALSGATADTLLVNTAGNYAATITNANGCTSAQATAVQVKVPCETGIKMPSIFTPNGDGVNDVIRPSLPGVAKFQCYKVYNRWGNLVFETLDATKGWDGTFKGALQPADTYIWIIQGEDRFGKAVKGTGMFTLAR